MTDFRPAPPKPIPATVTQFNVAPDTVINAGDGASAVIVSAPVDGSVQSIKLEHGESVGRAILRLRRRVAEKGKGPAPLPHRRKRP